jgi:hypothetical protein
VGDDYLSKFGDQAKTKKHTPAVESACATFLPAAFSRFSARGAWVWWPAITTEFNLNLLWKTGVEAGKAAGETELPVIQRKMLWHAKISKALMRAKAQMLLSRARFARVHSTLTAHRARCSHLASLRPPAQRPKDYNLAHSRRLCANKHAVCVTPNAQRWTRASGGY